MLSLQTYHSLLNMGIFGRRTSDVEARSNVDELRPPAQASPPTSSPTTPPIGSEKLAEFLNKYDPRPHDLPSVYPMSEHRAMMRTMYLDNILFNTARLHKHSWILMSQNELYKECSSPPRSHIRSLS